MVRGCAAYAGQELVTQYAAQLPVALREGLALDCSCNLPACHTCGNMHWLNVTAACRTACCSLPHMLSTLRPGGCRLCMPSDMTPQLYHASTDLLSLGIHALSCRPTHPVHQHRPQLRMCSCTMAAPYEHGSSISSTWASQVPHPPPRHPTQQA